MARFTRLQFWQLIVFCVYWFLFFPSIWFLIRPDFFAATILNAILFALILLTVYYLLYCSINCCCQPRQSTATPKRLWPLPARRGGDNPVYSPTTTSIEEPEIRLPMPDSVMYENPPRNKKSGLVCQEEPLVDEEGKSVRFITSCSLYYDGQDFHDFK